MVALFEIRERAVLAKTRAVARLAIQGCLEEPWELLRATAEDVLDIVARLELVEPETFPPEIAISGENGGGGNRTRVTFPADSALSSGNAVAGGDDGDPRPLVTRGAGA